MKSFMEFLLERKDVDTTVLDKIKSDNKYQLNIIPVTTNDKPSKSRFKALVGKELSSHSKRAEIMKYLAKTFNGELLGNAEDPTAVKFGDITLFVKPESKQGKTSDGVDSEYIIVNKINALIDEVGHPITIVFKSNDSTGTKKLICKDITSVEQCGKDASIKSKKIKADIRLLSKSTKYNISLKKIGAAWVENGSVYGHDWYVKTIENAIENGITKMSGSDSTGYKLSKTIYWEMTDDEKTAALFGDDILPNGGVIEATFTDDTTISQLDDNTYVIDVGYIITKLSDLHGKHDMAWFAINHHNRPGHWRGIYVRAAFMYRASPNTVEVDRIDKS